MSGTSEQARAIYVSGLTNQHAVETQAIELLERQVGRLQNYPQMEARMRQHISESREQARRLEDLLSQLGTAESGLKDTMMSFMGNMMAMAHAPARDEVIKNTLANYAFEHFEIASYKSLLTLADLTGHTAAINALRQSLGEEEAMAQWIDDHLAETARTFVLRAEAGETAGR